MRNGLILGVLLTTFLGLTTLITAQQEPIPDIQEGWDFKQICISEPTTPPEEWTFDGTILINGTYGVHGYRSEWDTTQVLAFTKNGYFSQLPYALSANGYWYVEAVGNQREECIMGCSLQFEVNTIEIHPLDLMEPRDSYGIPWSYTYSYSINAANPKNFTWINDMSVAFYFYGDGDDLIQVIDVNTGQRSGWKNDIDIVNSPDLSPDLTRRIIWTSEGERRYAEILDLEINTELDSAQLYSDTGNHVWSPDSQYVISYEYTPDENVGNFSYEIRILNRNGEFVALPLISQIYNFGSSSPGYVNDIKWTRDSSKFLLFLDERDIDISRPSNYIVDLENTTVIDTCLTSRYVYWSPDGTQLVTIYKGQLTIYNPQKEQWYAVTPINGYLLGWRSEN